MPLAVNNMDLLAKVEGTAGTAETLAASDGAFNAYYDSSDWQDDYQFDDRSNMQGFGVNTSTSGPRLVRFRFEVDFVGNGSASQPSWATTLLPMCGWTNSSGTFSPQVTHSTGTIGAYIDGIVRKMVGAVGTWTLPLIAGRAGRMQFEMIGKAADDADASLPSTTKPTTLPPRWAGTTNTLGGVALIASQATISANNVISMRENPGDATGYIAGQIEDRRPTVTLDPEAVLVASRNWQSFINSPSTEALSLVVGTAANNTQTVSAAAAQILSCPMGSRNGLATRNVELLCTGTTTSLQLVFA